jgi:hypothetical protein
MPEATTWYEITGYYRPQISPRLVSSETACYVFHPNGRKSSKGSVRGTDWHKTWIEARTELVRRATVRLDAARIELERAHHELDNILKMEEPHVKTESNQPATATV